MIRHRFEQEEVCSLRPLTSQFRKPTASSSFLAASKGVALGKSLTLGCEASSCPLGWSALW